MGVGSSEWEFCFQWDTRPRDVDRSSYCEGCHLQVMPNKARMDLRIRHRGKSEIQGSGFFCDRRACMRRRFSEILRTSSLQKWGFVMSSVSLTTLKFQKSLTLCKLTSSNYQLKLLFGALVHNGTHAVIVDTAETQSSLCTTVFQYQLPQLS